jgi:hypothetical protein
VSLELLRFRSFGAAPDGLLIIHSRVDPDDADVLGAVSMASLSRGEPSRRWTSHLIRDAAQLPDARLLGYHLCFAQPREPLEAAVDDAHWSGSEECLWLLSTLQGPSRYTTGPQNLRQLRSATKDLSGDWTCAIMRKGVAFIAHAAEDWVRPSPGESHDLCFVAETAPLLVRSLYTDAIAIALIKGLRLDDFALRLAELEDPVSAPSRLTELDSAFTRYRNTLWWQDTGLSGHATLLLRSYAAAYQHWSLFDRLVGDFSDYSQKVERDETRRANELSQGTNALIGLVTLFGLPLAALQVFGTKSAAVWILIAAFISLVGLLPAGDEIIGRNVPAWCQPLRRTWTVRAVWVGGWTIAAAVLIFFGALPLK